MTNLEYELRMFKIMLDPEQLALYRQWALTHPRGGGAEYRPQPTMRGQPTRGQGGHRIPQPARTP